jgi:Arm DNA-binding domain
MTRATPNRRRLTDGFLRKLKPQQRSFLIWDSYQRGLAVRVEPTGTKSWVCIYNFQRRSRWYLIGKADAIDLADARKLAGRVMFKVAEGQDPQAERKAERNSGTFSERWPDGFVKLDGQTHNVEVTSTHGGRKLGQEYRKVSGPTKDPVENWIARGDSIPKYLDEVIGAKKKKNYASPCWLVVYLNISKYGIRQAETEQVIAATKARYAEGFVAISVLWKGKLY